MTNSSLLGFIYNVTALLAVATIFDLTTSRWRLGKAWLHQVISGLVLSTIAVLVMATPWVYARGIVFDTLSVVLAISGLFFGLIPTVIVMAVTVTLRIAQGGDAVLTSVLVIVCTGAIGIIWGRLRQRPLSAIEWYDLYIFGIVIHVTMLTLMLTLPADAVVPVLTAISLPVLVIYPMATTLLGLLITNRLRRDQMIGTLTQRESELRAVIEQMPVPLSMNDAKQKMTFLNPKHVETFGYTLEDIPSLDEWWRKAYPDPDHRHQVQANWDHALAQARNKAFEVAESQVTCKDGTVRTVQINYVGLEGADLVIFHDLTERKRVEDVLRTSEEQFRTLVEEAPTPIYIQTNRQFAYANQATLRLFGAETDDQLLGRPVLDFFHPDYRDRVAMRMGEVNEARRSVPQVEMVIVKLDGSPVSVEISGVPFAFRQQPGALVFVYDLTARKRAESALRASELMLLKAQAVAHVGSWVWDIPANRLTWSDEMYRIFGVEPESFSGDVTDVIARTIHPDDRDAVEASNRLVVEEKKPFPLEYRICWADGTVRTVWAEAGELMLDSQGNPERLYGIVQDITWRKQGEQALRESESRYRDLLDRAPIGIAVLAGGELKFINPAGARILGAASSETVVGRHWREFVHPQHWSQFQERGQRMIAGEPIAYPIEDVYLKLDGTPTHVEVTAARLEHYGQTAVQLIITDITQRKQADEQLRRQATALESVADAIVITDRAGIIEWVNPAFTDLTGYSPAEVIGLSPHDVMGSGVQDQAFFRRMWETILGGEVWRGQLINRRKDHTFYPEEQSITPVRDSLGVVTHFVAVKQDISVRKRHELELETVAAVSAALRTASSCAEMQAAVLDQVIALFRVEGAAMELLDPVGGERRCSVGTWGLGWTDGRARPARHR